MENSITLLNKVKFSNLLNWSVQYLVESDFDYNEDYELVSIGSFLTRNKTVVNIRDDEQYTRVTVSSQNRGIKVRDVLGGKQIGTKKQYRIESNHFLMSKIDARNGAFGIVPKELDGAIVTNDFPSFILDENLINIEFLVLITTTKKFIEFAQSCSSGTTGRRRIDMTMFLAQKIPLPSLEEQNRIVANYNSKIKLAIEDRNKVEELEFSIVDLLYSELGIQKNQKIKRNKNLLNFIAFSNLHRWDGRAPEILESVFPVVKVEEIINEISTGTTPPTSRKEYFENGDINFYTPADLTDKMYLSQSARKVTQLAIDKRKARKFDQNTLLFVGIGSTVGKVGIIKNEYATSYQQITGLAFDKTKVEIDFAYLYFNYFSQITTKEKTRATIPIVNQNKILNIPFPLPPLNIQKRIINEVGTLKNEIDNLKSNSIKNEKLALSEFEKQIFSSK